MVHKERQKPPKNNATVYGICADYKRFWFYELGHDSKVRLHQRGGNTMRLIF